jgi:hypothetical protein
VTSRRGSLAPDWRLHPITGWIFPSRMSTKAHLFTTVAPFRSLCGRHTHTGQPEVLNQDGPSDDDCARCLRKRERIELELAFDAEEEARRLGVPQ